MTETILGNRYKLLEEIGSGGMAIVYKAKCLLLNRFVAVKILRPEFKEDKAFLKRFENESQSAAKLSHHNVVSVYDVGTDGDYHYIVMEYVEGVTLKQYINKHGVMNWEEAIDCATQICAALDAAHKCGIVHKDIKPHNVMITPEGIVKVTDFGIARISNSNTIAVGDTSLGSVHYLSPEQARGSVVDARSDLYSLGVVMYEMLTGRPPFDGDTAVSVAMKQIEEEPAAPRIVNPKIPPVIESIVLKALRKNKDQRYQNASEMMIDLKRAYINPQDNFLATDDSTGSNTKNRSKVTDTTTRIPVISNLAAEKEYANRRDAGPKTAVKEKKGRTKGSMKKEDRIAIIAAVITSFVIISIISVIVYNMMYPANPDENTGMFEVPSLSGKTVKEAENEVKGKDVKIVVDSEEYSRDIEKDHIIRHTPGAGEEETLPVEIKVVLSKGVQEIRLDSYTNMKYSDAEAALEKLNLMYRVVFQSSSLPEGTVISHEPAVGETVKTGDIIVLYVSGQKPPTIATVPNLIGSTEKEAKQAIERAKLTLGSVKSEESTKPAGTVIKQSLKPDINVAEMTAVDIVLAKAAEIETPAPQTKEPQVTAAPTTPPASNKTKPVYINLPRDAETVLVKVVANGKVIHEQTHNTSEGTIMVNVTGTGSVDVQIYFDGVLRSTQNINLA